MKKIVVVLAAVILTVFLTFFFFLTPLQIISKFNDAQQAVVLSAGKSGGNFLTGYHFTNASFAGKEGARLLLLDEATLDIHLLPLIFGRIGIDVHSKEITAVLSAGLDGSVKGEASFHDVPFDTAALIVPAEVSFTAPISGRVTVSGRKADIEVKAEQISWKKLSVSGFDLPPNLFEKGKGALSVEGDRITVRSLAFEGGKGYARLSGEILGGQRSLTLELFPSDWNDFMLLPLERYKVSPGQYKMTLNS
ncbi:MAG: type II secretion system protein GspN [Nitrospirae bacterium]|nr:type II secretion system protein GspN [Nitrospirota bacterium]